MNRSALGLLLTLFPLVCWSVEDRSGFLIKASAAPERSFREGDRPNVLFILADDLNLALGSYLPDSQRVQYDSAYTPNIDALAASGARFTNAFVQTPLCNPSRASLLTGLRPSTLNVYDGRTWPRHKIGSALRMLPEHFSDQGYFTARVGKVSHNSFEHAVSWDFSAFALSREPSSSLHFPGYLPGEDWSSERDNTWQPGAEQGLSRADLLSRLDRPAGLPISWRATSEQPRMTPDGTTAGRVIQLLSQYRDRPFFIAAGFHKPHQPWVGPKKFFDLHPIDAVKLPLSAAHREDVPEPARRLIPPDDAALTVQQHKQAIAAYHAMVSMIDEYVGQLMQALEDLELLESTVVVFTSDHGFQLGEHGGIWRKRVQFDESIRVPLIIRLPGEKAAGRTISGLVELVDLYPTLAEICQLPPPAHKLEGFSFAKLLETPDLPWKSAAFSESKRSGYHGKTIRTEQYRYTEWQPIDPGKPTSAELYDLLNDPLEQQNLANHTDWFGTATDLAERLQSGWRSALPAVAEE